MFVELSKKQIQYILWILYKKWLVIDEKIKNEKNNCEPNIELIKYLNNEIETIKGIIEVFL